MTRAAKTKINLQTCQHCEHYMCGFYKSTQLIPGNVCNLRKKEMKHMKNMFPKRVYYYKAKPDGYCNEFKEWKQPTINEIYGDNKD